MVASFKAEVFISYSKEDSDSCDRVECALTKEGFIVWRYCVAVRPGDSWVRSIFRGLESADLILLLLSHKALKSPWCRKEMETALLRTVVANPRQRLLWACLEPIQIPTELATIQGVNLHTDFASGLQKLILALRAEPLSPHSTPPSVPASQVSALSAVFSQLGELIFKLKPSKHEYSKPLHIQFWNLHQELLRLQAIVEEIAAQGPASADALWYLAGELCPNPIPNPNSVVANAVSQQFSDLGDRPSFSSSQTTSLISLASRYVDIMGRIVSSLHSFALESLSVNAPEVAELLTRLFKSKISIYKAVKTACATEDNLRKIADDKVVMDYIEATRTLEARALLQVIDADARAVASDSPTGLIVFREIVKEAPAITASIIQLRRNLGGYLRREGFEP